MGNKKTKLAPAEAAYFDLAQYFQPDIVEYVAQPTQVHTVETLATFVRDRNKYDVAAWVESLRNMPNRKVYEVRAQDTTEPAVTILDLAEKDKIYRAFLAILGGTGSIMKSRGELRKAGVDSINVNPDQMLKVACAFPTNYPGHVLLVIGEETAVGKLGGSWQVADRFKGQALRTQLATTDEFDELFMSLVDRLLGDTEATDEDEEQ